MWNALKSLSSRLRRDERGNVAIMFALTLVPLIGAAGFAVDYSAASRQRSELQAAADSAVLAALAALPDTATDAQRIQKAQDFFAAQLANRKITGAAGTATMTSGTLAITASMPSPSVFAKIYGGGSPVGVKSGAKKGAPGGSGGLNVLDVAMCVDATGSMQPSIDAVRTNINGFYTNLNAEITKRGKKPFDKIRARLIVMRDYMYPNGSAGGINTTPVHSPMVQYPFKELPAQANDIATVLASEVAEGGYDTPESQHECWNYAMMSPWVRKGTTYPGTSQTVAAAMSIIVMWTDAVPTSIPDFRRSKPAPSATWYYPPVSEMPITQTNFTAKWKDQNIIDQSSKMFILFGPCTATEVWNWGTMSWAYGLSLDKTVCGGTVTDGNTNMIVKIVDAMVTVLPASAPTVPMLTD